MIEFGKTIEIENKHYYEINEEIKQALNITKNYFPISVESINEIIKLSIDKYNNDADIIIENNIQYMAGNNLGRPIEYLLSQYMHLNDAKLNYKQGNEGNEPDLTCLDNDLFSIEVKTGKTLIKDPNKCRPIIIGNSAYAKDKQDDNSRKSKNHFYILINYNFNNYKIINYKAWFGFVKQEDWSIPNKGAASKLNIDNIDVQKRIIKLYE